MILLPREIQLNEIYQYLSYESIINLSLVNNDTYLINKDDNLWIHLLHRDFGIEYESINIDDLYNLYDISWKNIFYRDFENKIKNVKYIYVI